MMYMREKLGVSPYKNGRKVYFWTAKKINYIKITKIVGNEVYISPKTSVSIVDQIHELFWERLRK